MKFFKNLFTLFFIISLSSVSHAQFFKKLKKRAENAVERTVLNKTDREVSKTTDKTIDEVIKGDEQDSATNNDEVSNKKNSNFFGGRLENLPNTYEFQYTMDMKMSTKRDETTLRYFVQPDAKYFGNTIPEEQSNTLIVYDLGNQAMVTFMDNNGEKIAMKMDIPQEELQTIIENNENGNNSTDITPLPSKIILGYTCKGYLVQQEEGTAKIYITNEAPISFVGMFANLKKMQKNLTSSAVPFDENSLMMEMEYTSHKRKKDNVHMICTSIKKQPFSIHTSQYKSGF